MEGVKNLVIKDKNLIYNITTFRKTDVGEARDVIVMQKAQLNVPNLGALGQDSPCRTERHINLHGWPFQWKAALSIQWQVDGHQPEKTVSPPSYHHCTPTIWGTRASYLLFLILCTSLLLKPKANAVGAWSQLPKKSYGVSCPNWLFHQNYSSLVQAQLHQSCLIMEVYILCLSCLRVVRFDNVSRLLKTQIVQSELLIHIKDVLKFESNENESFGKI